MAAVRGQGGRRGRPRRLALPMRRGDESMGALLLLDVSGRGRPDLEIAQALAEAAAVGLRHAHALHRSEAVGAQLREALRSRVVIEQAKGRWRCTPASTWIDAFTVMRRYARGRGIGLTELARRLVTGELDPVGDRAPQAPAGRAVTRSVQLARVGGQPAAGVDVLGQLRQRGERDVLAPRAVGHPGHALTSAAVASGIEPGMPIRLTLRSPKRLDQSRRSCVSSSLPGTKKFDAPASR